MVIRKRIWTAPNGEQKQAYQVDYRDAGGKRQRPTFATKKEAEAAQARITAELFGGVHTARGCSVTIAAAAQQWLDDCDPVCERTTVAAYSQHVRLHIVPRLGAVRLSDLTVPVVAQFLRDLRSAGVSNAMIRKIRVSLGALIALAQENGLVSQNVVRAKRRERQARGEVARKRAEVGVDIPLPAEIRAILPQLQGRLRTLILTAAFTGLRWSELRGLPWSNVDLKGAELSVTQRIDRHGKVGAPKSDAGNRTLPLLPLIVNALREHKVASVGDLVFANAKGNPEHRNTVINYWQAAQVAAGVVTAEGKAKYSGLHALRHFFASWCINRKADGGRELPLKVVQGLLGHSSVTVTADVYSHLFPRLDDAAELAAAETAFLAG